MTIINKISRAKIKEKELNLRQFQKNSKLVGWEKYLDGSPNSAPNFFPNKIIINQLDFPARN